MDPMVSQVKSLNRLAGVGIGCSLQHPRRITWGSTTAIFGESHARQPGTEHTSDAQAGNLIAPNGASALPQRHARETSVNPVSLLGRQWRTSKIGPWSTIPRVPNWTKHVPGFLSDYTSSLVGQAHVYGHRVPPVSRHKFEP